MNLCILFTFRVYPELVEGGRGVFYILGSYIVRNSGVYRSKNAGMSSVKSR